MIVSLSPEEQEEVLHFARILDTGSALAGRELAVLAEKLSGTDDEHQVAELRPASRQRARSARVPRALFGVPPKRLSAANTQAARLRAEPPPPPCAASAARRSARRRTLHARTRALHGARAPAHLDPHDNPLRAGIIPRMTPAAPEAPIPSPSHDDRIKKLLLQPRLLVDFFRAFLPQALEFADLDHIEYLDKEHPRTGRRPRRTGDLLIKTRWRSRPAAFLIHIESQSTPQGTLLERAAEYALRDSIRYRLPVMPVILLTYPKPETTPARRLRWDFGRLAAIHVRCPILHFRRIDPGPHLESHNVAALALSALMKLDAGQQVEAIVQTLAEVLRQRLGPEEMEAALDFVHAYTELRPEQLLQLEQKVRTFARNEKILTPMPKLINPFIEIGKLKGREEGREEGRAEGECHVVLRQLERKFPQAFKKAAPRVRKLDEEKLLAFGEALLFMNSAAECLEWLKERG